METALTVFKSIEATAGAIKALVGADQFGSKLTRQQRRMINDAMTEWVNCNVQAQLAQKRMIDATSVMTMLLVQMNNLKQTIESLGGTVGDSDLTAKLVGMQFETLTGFYRKFIQSIQ